MVKKSLAALLFLLAACTPQIDQTKPFDLMPVPFYKVPGWASDDLAEVLPAIYKSCQSPRTDWKEFCQNLPPPQSINKVVRRYLEQNLSAYQVYSYGSDQGTFTGYYESSLKGSFEKTGTCNVPIYGMPNDLVRVDLNMLCKTADTPTFMGRVENGKLMPYFKRSEIREDTIKAPVLLWVDDEVDAFILHIQGSGRIETADGQVVHVGYAGNNGHEFVGIGGIMSKKGVLEPGKASMPHIREWLKKNPRQARELMAENPRYIFFRILPGADGPLGAAGVPLTPKRSLAVDTTYIQLGTPIFLDTKDPDGKPIQHLVMAQDIGSAIKGGIRGDYFWGYGEDAFQKAGRMKSAGSYYILWPKGKLPPKP